MEQNIRKSKFAIHANRSNSLDHCSDVSSKKTSKHVTKNGYKVFIDNVEDNGVINWDYLKDLKNFEGEPKYLRAVTENEEVEIVKKKKKTRHFNWIGQRSQTPELVQNQKNLLDHIKIKIDAKKLPELIKEVSRKNDRKFHYVGSNYKNSEECNELIGKTNSNDFDNNEYISTNPDNKKCFVREGFKNKHSPSSPSNLVTTTKETFVRKGLRNNTLKEQNNLIIPSQLKAKVILELNDPKFPTNKSNNNDIFRKCGRNMTITMTVDEMGKKIVPIVKKANFVEPGIKTDETKNNISSNTNKMTQKEKNIFYSPKNHKKAESYLSGTRVNSLNMFSEKEKKQLEKFETLHEKIIESMLKNNKK